MDKTEISAKKNQSLPKNNQKNSLLIGSSKIMQVSEPEKTDQSKRKKEIKKLYISRLSTAVLSTFIILSLGVGGIYLLTKNGFNHGTFEKIEEFDNTFDSLESSQFDNYKLKTKDTTTTALDNKLNELNKKVDVLNISLKEKKNLNKLHQIEISQTNSKYTKKGAAKDKEASAKESSIYSPNNQIKYLLVKKGDSLNEIIMREYGGLDEKVLSMILMSNPEIKDPNLINENQILRLPPKKYYELAEEDTNSQDIWKIEQRNW